MRGSARNCRDHRAGPRVKRAAFSAERLAALSIKKAPVLCDRHPLGVGDLVSQKQSDDWPCLAGPFGGVHDPGETPDRVADAKSAVKLDAAFDALAPRQFDRRKRRVKKLAAFGGLRCPCPGLEVQPVSRAERGRRQPAAPAPKDQSGREEQPVGTAPQHPRARQPSPATLELCRDGSLASPKAHLFAKMLDLCPTMYQF